MYYIEELVQFVKEDAGVSSLPSERERERENLFISEPNPLFPFSKFVRPAKHRIDNLLMRVRTRD